MQTIIHDGKTWSLPDQIVIMATHHHWDVYAFQVLTITANQTRFSEPIFEFVDPNKDSSWIYVDELDEIKWITPEKFENLKAFL
jgi:hypothetical protein